MSKVVEIIIVQESESGDEAMYVDGKLIYDSDTIYCSDIIDASEGNLIRLTQEFADLPEGADWPGTMDELNDLQDQIAAGDDDV